MDQLAIRFTEWPRAFYFNEARVLIGSTNESFDPREFGSEGFGRPFYDPPIGNVPSNQVRHAVSGLIAGYVMMKRCWVEVYEQQRGPK